MQELLGQLSCPWEDSRTADRYGWTQSDTGLAGRDPEDTTLSSPTPMAICNFFMPSSLLGVAEGEHKGGYLVLTDLPSSPPDSGLYQTSVYDIWP